MADTLDLVVHSTHEAGTKLGGIGAVLDGLLTQPAYNDAVKRTILVGPVNTADELEMSRLYAPRNNFRAEYVTWREQNPSDDEDWFDEDELPSG